ncbi:MAG: hypothetical protein R3297_09525, partial [Desulfobulbales bacterium]|nr:hypothetical protein [Desulfobulbales bacterium]
MKTINQHSILLMLLIFSVPALSACSQGDKPDSRHEVSLQEKIVKGGNLYDKWWVAAKGSDHSEKDHPLWKLQNTNKRKGSATWRCKEC